MNILPPVPTPTVFNVGTVNTEAVRRDNTQREAVPQLVANEKSAAETAVGSEADKVKPPGQAPPPLTYEKPVPQTGQQFNTQNDAAKDNGQDASAGKENAEEQQQKKQQQVEQQVIEFKQRDSEVRAHEQAHASLGGQYATQPEYEYERGPDGRRYAVSGEVSIDISKASTPEETIRKAQRVKAAALAPTEPSVQDLRVATEATQIAFEARSEIASEKVEKAQESFIQAILGSQKNEEQQEKSVIGEIPSLDEIVDALDVGIPTRSLNSNQSEVDEQSVTISEFDLDAASQFLANRVSVIEHFYQKVSIPRTKGIQQSA